MTPVLVRTLAVLVVWGGALGASIAAGARPRPAELAALLGAAATLLVWGLVGNRPRARRPTISADSSPAAAPTVERERDAG